MNFLETVKKGIELQISRIKLENEIDRYLAIINDKKGRVDLAVINQTEPDIWLVPVDTLGERVFLNDIYEMAQIIDLPGQRIEVIFRNNKDEIEGIVNLFGQAHELSAA